MSRRAVTTIGAIGAAGVGYYLYNAGGDTTVAKKDAEKDLAKLTNNQSGEAQKQGEAWAHQAGAKGEQWANQASAKAQEAQKEAQAKLNQAGAQFDKSKQDISQKFAEIRSETDKKINQFDNTVEKKASEAKSGISSWWGGSSK